MSTDLGVIVIHGMGSQKPNFDQGLVEELEHRLGDQRSRVAFKRVFWQDLLEDAQREYLRDARKDPNDLDAITMRKFVVSSFGDALAYQRVESGHNNTYESIHARFAASVQDLYENKLGSRDKPLVVIAHSLGAQIASNYIWDLQNGNASDRGNDFENMKTLAGLVTFGCNIPLFSFAFRNVQAIQFPGDRLDEPVRRKARWLNYYDPDDILGYPLKPLSPSYRETVSEDTPINVGGLLSSWNPLSHAAYWTDNDLTVPVAKFLGKLLDVI